MRRGLTLLVLVCIITALRCTTFSGRVVDVAKRPIARARIEVNDSSTRTRSDGTFQLLVPTSREYILNINHDRYAAVSDVFRIGVTGQQWILTAVQLETVNPQSPVTIRDRRPGLRVGGATIELPANVLVDRNGNPPAGNVQAAIATLDLTNGEGPNNWAVRSDDGQQEGFLVSYGAVFVRFSDSTGAVEYRLRPGAQGRLTLPVLPTMSVHAPNNAAARFWYYDEGDSYWKRTGDAVFDAAAGAYVGMFDHLSTLNTDIAKFDAACLKVTLDPSISVGNRLRIRYHSGGTPFGQTPSFVLNDTVNAAYRLPANTNVLLELLDASNDVFGNVVVEDPPGTALVNTVVNTGPPIPPGGSLWPPAPYTPCHAVVLRLATPQVEIRINELPTDAAPRDNPTDDYLTWAPTYARARLSPPMISAVSITLTNDAPGSIPGGGDVNFAAHVDPWPVNTTATSATLALTLPADGSWVPFMVAGRFGSPSTNDKDTIIEAHQGGAAGPVIGTKALMVRVRKNANTLTAGERARFLFAWQKFRNKAGDNFIQFQEMHRLATMAGDEGHMQPAFLSWHRTLLLHVERELQKLEPSVALHYWDWDAAAPNVFSADFMGAGATGAGGAFAEPVFSLSNPLNGWNTDLPFSSGRLRRTTQDHTRDPAGAMKPTADMIADWSSYGPTSASIFAVNSFSDDVERRSHNDAHGWPCGGGQLFTDNRSAADPLFYLLHSNVDRQWAAFQQVRNRHGVISGGVLTFPAPAHYDNNGNWNTPGNTADANFRQKGSFLNDGLWPWDGTSDGPAGTPETRPPNQAGGSLDDGVSDDIPTSTPIIPMSPFPASAVRNLWPATPIIPTNANVIDYLGKFRPRDGLGMCYDTVPY